MYAHDKAELVRLLGVAVTEASPHGDIPEAAGPLARVLMSALLYREPLFFGGGVVSMLRQLIAKAKEWVTQEEAHRAETLIILLERSFASRQEAIERERILSGRSVETREEVVDDSFREAA